MIKADLKAMHRLEKDLKHFRRSAVPFAQRDALNNTAFAARAEAGKDIRNKFTNRNKFTAASLRVDMAKGSDMQSKMGSIAPYMAIQEAGGTESSTGKHGRAITTPYAAGQGQGARPRTRLARKPNKIGSINLQRSRGKGSRKRRNFIAIRSAAKSGRKHVFLKLKRSIGYFKIVGGKRKPRIKMLHNLTQRSVTIKADPTIKPAALRAQRDMPRHYAKALKNQAKRFGLFT